MPDLPIPEDERPNSRRRALLRFGEGREWWVYESENPPGHVDRRGRRYEVTTYTILRPSPVVDGRQSSAAVRERVLLADEVEGYVLGRADHEPDADQVVAQLAYRQELLPRE